MSENNQVAIYRDVQTLLFCKDVPSPHDYSSLFKKIGTLTKGKQAKTFLAFGGYDAICIYPPKLDTNASEWLHEVYVDKQNAIKKPPQDVHYHQIHLVSQNPDTQYFWDGEDKEYPFFLTTLVYGVNVEKYRDESFRTSERECSLYEKTIRRYLEERKEADRAAVKYAVYNGITAGDVIVLWRTKDLSDAMKLISRIEYSGVARKTLSTLGFPVDETGKIEKYVIEYLVNHPDKRTNISLRGAVRNITAFLEIRDELCCVMPKANWSQSLGKNDLSASTSITYAELARLLEVYQFMTGKFYDACWEFLTDIQTEHIDPDEKERIAARLPQRVLCELYKAYQEMYEANKKNGLDIMDYSWFNALQELLSTHHYIDHDPVLHGASYLIYRSLLIAYNYLAGQVKDYDTTDKLQVLLKRSEENIISLIRNLDQLTEQISRNDDAMLNSHGNARTVHFSLPERALEFYHAYLRRIADYVLEYDKNANLMPDDFEYDFLLSPITCSRFSSRPVFKTDHQDHGNLSGKVWPNKQAYVLELPLESVFKPIDIFIPFVHECFHCFGDQLRHRKLRKQEMALFIASSLLNRARMGRNSNQDLCILVAQIIYPGENRMTGDYLRVTNRQLEKSTSRLLDMDSVDMLLTDLERPISQDLRQRLEQLRTELLKINSTDAVTKTTGQIKAVVEDCNHLFKECYADAMAVSLLGLKPWEYLGSYLGELRRSYDSRRLGDDEQEAAFHIRRRLALSAQRFGIVLATCSAVGRDMGIEALKEFTDDICLAEIEKFKEKRMVFESDEYTNLFVDYLRQSFQALTDYNMHIPSTSDMHSPAAMRHVMNYLKVSIKMLYQDAPVLMVPKGDRSADIDESKRQLVRYPYKISNLQVDFDHIIRSGNMFGKNFYDMINVYHMDVREKVKCAQGDRKNISGE